MQLQLSTWPEVEDYLKGSTGIIIPIGSTEQHGPNGLIGTDAICPEVIAKGIGAATGALIAPTISVGMAQHHMAFTGSMTLRPSTLIAVIRDEVVGLARHGFDRFLFLNGHGGNIATIRAAFSEIHAEASLAKAGNAPALRLRLKNWWDTPKVRVLSAELYGDKEGDHATCSEVSVTQFAYPDEIKPVTFEGTAPRNSGFGDALDYRRRYPDGRIGSDPSLARPEHGKRLYDAAVADIAEDWRGLLAEA
ncbi:MAG: creatininase family protein [Alphaproteobacteria bacterium]